MNCNLSVAQMTFNLKILLEIIMNSLNWRDPLETFQHDQADVQCLQLAGQWTATSRRNPHRRQGIFRSWTSKRSEIFHFNDY